MALRAAEVSYKRKGVKASTGLMGRKKLATLLQSTFQIDLLL